jgi:hypothetical protein
MNGWHACFGSPNDCKDSRSKEEKQMKTPLLATTFVVMSSLAANAQDAGTAAQNDTAATQESEISAMLLAQARTQAQVTAALEDQGYRVEKVRRSLLGRVIITARSAAHVREVVMSRATGEILSDQIIETVVAGSTNIDGDAESSSANGGGSFNLGADVSSGADASAETGGAGVSAGGSVGVSIGVGN